MQQYSIGADGTEDIGGVSKWICRRSIVPL